MRGAATVLVFVAVASADDAAAQIPNRTSQSPVSVLAGPGECTTGPRGCSRVRRASAQHGRSRFSRGRLIAVVISTNSAEKMPSAAARAAACHAVEGEHERDPDGTSKRPARAVVDQGKAAAAKRAHEVGAGLLDPDVGDDELRADCQSDFAN